MNTKTETAIEAYLKAMQEIENQLAALQDKAAGHKAAGHFGSSPDEVNWGHVGDLKRLINLLRQANGEEV